MTTRQRPPVPAPGTVTGRPRCAANHEPPAGTAGPEAVPGAARVSTCPLALSNSMSQVPGGSGLETGPELGGATKPWLSMLLAHASRLSSACRIR